MFEPIFKQYNFRGRWIIDHAETISEKNLNRVNALGGGIAIQNRMAFAGEFFVKRYGKIRARFAPPLRKLVASGVPLGAGTDTTRVSSHNPWLSLAWMVTGKTVGGMELYDNDNKLTREEALRLYTVGSAWFSSEENVKGRIKVGQFADVAILSEDYFSVPENRIKEIESVLTVVDGRPVYAAGDLREQVTVSELPPVIPAWSPVAFYGGYQK